MRSICLYFKVHQPIRLRKFRFFDIGNESYYYDDYNNEIILRRVIENCYLPANKLILDLINKYQGRFRVSFSISGTAIDQFKIFAPEVLESFKELAATGHVEFLAEPYAHSLAAVKDQTEFRKQIETHAAEIESLFGKKPEVFSNTDQIYSDKIGAFVAEMGYKAILAEGSSHVMKWRSPNYLYSNAINKELTVMLKNDMLSDDIAFRFSNKHWVGWPLTAQKYVSWLNKIPKHEKIVNLFIDYETFGERQKAETGIFNFLETLPLNVCRKSDFQFQTLSEALNHHECISILNMPEPTSCADHERDLSAWLGNELQKDAFENLYELSEQILHCTDRNLLKDWQYLQTSDHFYYMSTKHHSDGNIHSILNPYNSPYEAFLNYSNILNDFTLRLNRKVKVKTLKKNMLSKDESLPNPHKSSAKKTHKTSNSNIF